MSLPPSIQDSITARMQSGQLHELAIREFLRRTELLHGGESGKADWQLIGDLPADLQVDLETDMQETAGLADWDKLAIIKLNGGLGTSMGLSKPKSIIAVKQGLNFLEIIRNQITALRKKQDCELPLLLMNSFNTREDSLAVPGIAGINRDIRSDLPADFVQNRVPRLRQSDLMPLDAANEKDNWCPPGHGDIFLALQITGMLDKLLEAGHEVAFISNGDNLGATADPRILKYFIEKKLDWASEVTPKTRADLKGGVLYRHKQSGRIELLETAQVDETHLAEFQDISKFPYFNINNLWVNLRRLKERLEAGGMPLALIINPKEVDGEPVWQLETAMGAAIGNFEKSRVIVVPRTRFAPVKSCADLLVRRSDLYQLDSESWQLSMHSERQTGEPEISLDSYYKKIGDFEKLFATIPSLLHIQNLQIEGPVLFDRAVELRGAVRLANKASDPLSIAAFIEKNNGSTVFADCEIVI